MKLTMIVVLVCLLATPVFAGDLFAEAKAVAEGAVENVELSLLGGTVGWGAGAYWPLVEIEQIDTTLGPFIAFGSELIAAGVGAKIPVTIPVLDNYVDFLAAGGAYKHDDLTFEVWVGNTLPLR